MFSYLKEVYGGKRILHIGDSMRCDIEEANKSGIMTFYINSAEELGKISGINSYIEVKQNIGDILVKGFFYTKIFSNPFALNKTKGKLYIPDMEYFGYLFWGPLVLKFMLWLLSEVKNADLDTICFVARDGYILRLLYEKIEKYYGINEMNCI